jgi:preprotein translocase subunit Sec63
VEGIFKAAERSHLTIERVTSERFAAAWKLRQRFQDKPKISFTDLTSMIIMRERQKGFNGGRAFPASRNELPKGSLSLHVQTKFPRKHAGVHKRSEGKHTLASPGHRERPREFHEKIAIPPTVWQEALFPPECLEIYR